MSTGATAVPDAAPSSTQPSPRALRSWVLLLHNDDINTFDHVIGALQSLLRMEHPLAFEAAVEAHQEGAAVVMSGAREHLEFHGERLQSAGLTVTIEPG